MKRLLLFLCALMACGVARTQQPATLHVLAFYSDKVEHDHVDFAHQAIQFFSGVAQRDHFEFASTVSWDDMNAENLAKYQVVMWLDDFPHTAQQKAAFEQYMTHGGGWLGFHIAAYNDSGTHWPWFVDFLGGGVFYGNEWPPLPAKLTIDDPAHPVVKRMPQSFVSPSNEWYIWKPSPRENKDVKVLMTLAPSNYPIGLKDVLAGGDLPVVWTNQKYRMLYMNMGHGDRVLTSDVQNQLFEDGLLWVASTKQGAVK
ncbi:ThuA domain-containing protein [Granulicella sibirica]|uniref:Putative secreted glycosyl hydrolase n=1 Tax=Granulicella sibirica TaxID=2479048 RepID=A0A4Q0SVW3_9BACT|nr:ThuA domain-containing protein [Granulicella sibirica]RXH54937.1 putative secreted glycosyl hydrolase [Granulicella sibirica]